MVSAELVKRLRDSLEAILPYADCEVDYRYESSSTKEEYREADEAQKLIDIASAVLREFDNENINTESSQS